MKTNNSWLHTKSFIYDALGLLSNGKILNDENSKRYSKRRLRRIITHDIPCNQRQAALTLYARGERDFAVDFLIQQMNLYKIPGTSPQTIGETCVRTAIALGRLKDKRAEPPLLDALGSLPFFGAAYALSFFNDNETTEKLERIASLESEKGIHAIMALGFLSNEKALPWLIEIVENKDKYDEKYNKAPTNSLLLADHAYQLLGLYNSEKAESFFLSSLDKHRIDRLLLEYVNYERVPDAYSIGFEVGWYVARKYGWVKHLSSDAARFVFIHTDISHWKTYMTSICPFKSQEDIDALRESILDEILNGIKNYIRN